jgi:hypothetical protein
MKIENGQSYQENGQFSGGLFTTGSNGDDLPFVARGLYIGTAGNLVVDTVDGSNLTFVSASGFIPGHIRKIYTSGTTATNIIALK